MTKDEAREILEKHLTEQVVIKGEIKLPIKDNIVFSVADSEFAEVSFVGLLMIAYDLKEK